MCTTTHYTSLCCDHHWLAIRAPCRPGSGFRYCGMFRDGVAREPADELKVGAPCPACACGPGGYDANLVRMILNVRNRWRWGVGPSRGDPGLECAVM
ncbi:hypothetical protein GGR56DRAFT_670832 [Xylariaceae sp. FL0804]|nr:hypothetical protein GGR56DRAFT_670832 [Xylariaceae sp. FL0804]